MPVVGEGDAADTDAAGLYAGFPDPFDDLALYDAFATGSPS
jgi:hypothetical protein